MIVGSFFLFIAQIYLFHSHIHCHSHTHSHKGSFHGEFIRFLGHSANKKYNYCKQNTKYNKILLNKHNTIYETSTHSTRVRIIISTDFTVLVAAE